MDSLITKYHGHHHNIFSHLRTQQQISTPPQWQQTVHTSTKDFPIAVALLAIMAVALLVVSYYIFVIKCCLNWQNIDPLRRFSISRRVPITDDHSLMAFSPMVEFHRGLDEWLINNIPAFQYKGKEKNSAPAAVGERSFRGCAVCLNDFEEQEMLRVLPRCSHVFHLDCIDVWLLNNASCPLCRSSISGRTKYPIDQIIAPSSSPQDHYSPYSGSLSINISGEDQDYLVIELGGGDDIERSISRELSRVQSRGQSQRKMEPKGLFGALKSKKFQHLSIMGDECINVRQKDEQFTVQQPIRRSFSMDSAVDRGLCLQVQQIIRQNRGVSTNNNEVLSGSSNNHEESNSNGRIRRSSFFSFGHGRGSRSSSILPIECDR